MSEQSGQVVSELLAALHGLLSAIERTPCSCDAAYTGRGLTDPSCIGCGIDVTQKDLDAARAAISKAEEWGADNE